MKCKLTYYLSEAGRKAILKAGGNGKCYQTTEVEISADQLDACSVTDNGSVRYDVLSIYRFDVPITSLADALAAEAKCQATVATAE